MALFDVDRTAALPSEATRANHYLLDRQTPTLVMYEVGNSVNVSLAAANLPLFYFLVTKKSQPT